MECLLMNEWKWSFQYLLQLFFIWYEWSIYLPLVMCLGFISIFFPTYQRIGVYFYTSSYVISYLVKLFLYFIHIFSKRNMSILIVGMLSSFKEGKVSFNFFKVRERESVDRIHQLCICTLLNKSIVYIIMLECTIHVHFSFLGYCLNLFNNWLLLSKIFHIFQLETGNCEIRNNKIQKNSF